MNANYVINPRVLNWVTRDWQFDIKWEMEQMNKGKFRWMPVVIGILTSLACAILPFLVKGDVIAPVAVMCLLYGPFMLWATMRIIRQRKEYAAQWKALRRQVCSFYETFYILPWNGSLLSYDEIVEKVRGTLTVLAAEVLETKGAAQIEVRRMMHEKYDVAQEYLSPGFNDCRGYRFFFEAAQQSFDPCI